MFRALIMLPISHSGPKVILKPFWAICMELSIINLFSYVKHCQRKCMLKGSSLRSVITKLSSIEAWDVILSKSDLQAILHFPILEFIQTLQAPTSFIFCLQSPNGPAKRMHLPYPTAWHSPIRSPSSFGLLVISLSEASASVQPSYSAFDSFPKQE